MLLKEARYVVAKTRNANGGCQSDLVGRQAGRPFITSIGCTIPIRGT